MQIVQIDESHQMKTSGERTLPTRFLRDKDNLTDSFNIREQGDLAGYGDGPRQPKGPWEDFRDDIKNNGIKDPIEIYINEDGKIDVIEGTHRLLAAEELGITEVPFYANGYYKQLPELLQRWYEK